MSKIKDNYNKLSLLGIINKPEEPLNPKYLVCDPDADGSDSGSAGLDTNCIATIKKTEADDDRARLRRVAATPMGTYPPFLMPQGYYELHQMVYRPPTKSDVGVDCAQPTECHVDVVIKNIERLLYRSTIPFSFPGLSTSKDIDEYKESIELETPFVNLNITV